MRRTKKALWFLLSLQALPLVVAVAGASGILDPLGAFVIQSIPLPLQARNRAFSSTPLAMSPVIGSLIVFG